MKNERFDEFFFFFFFGFEEDSFVTRIMFDGNRVVRNFPVVWVSGE